jgi:hypothetical protein
MSVGSKAALPLTSSDLLAISKTHAAIKAYLAKNDIPNAPNESGQTIAHVYDIPGLGNEDRSAAIAQIVCGPMPVVVQTPTANQIGQMANWRFSAAILAYTLACYHEYVGDEAKLAADIYQIAFQYDSLVSKDSLHPLHGLPGWQYRLGDAPLVKNFINDAGMGVFSGLGWFKSLGIVPATYCTQLEMPSDDGQNCKTINLHDRIARLAEHVLRSTDGFREWRSDQQFLSRSSVGRAAAAVIFGDSNEKFKRLLEANGYVCNVQQGISDPSPGDLVPWENARVSNDANYQHVQVLMEADNWNLPIELKAKAKKFYNNYVAVYFNNVYPISDIAGNSYRPDHISKLWGVSHITSTCGSDGSGFTTNPVTGITVGWAGENLSDALTTIGPPLYNLLKLSGQPEQAHNVMTNTSASLDAITQNPTDYRNMACVAGALFGAGSTTRGQLQISLFEMGFLYYTLRTFSRTPMSSYAVAGTTDSADNIIPPMRGASNFILGNVLYQSSWRAGVGYSRTIQISNGRLDLTNISNWSAPISDSGLPGSGQVQAVGNAVYQNNLVQVVWRSNIGYSRTVPYSGSTVDWKAASAWQSATLTNYPGLGDIQSYSLVNNTDGGILEAYWRGNLGYSRVIPSGVQFGLCTSLVSCSVSGPISISGLPGSGDIESQADYVLGNTLNQSIWRSGGEYSRTVPIVNNAFAWNSASTWLGPVYPSGF